MDHSLFKSSQKRGRVDVGIKFPASSARSKQNYVQIWSAYVCLCACRLLNLFVQIFIRSAGHVCLLTVAVWLSRAAQVDLVAQARYRVGEFAGIVSEVVFQCDSQISAVGHTRRACKQRGGRSTSERRKAVKENGSLSSIVADLDLFTQCCRTFPIHCQRSTLT